MAITYTNRKGKTYTLFRSKTKTGKYRYYFAKTSTKGEPCGEIPEGYEIRESPNGIVSLAKKRPGLFRQAEIDTIKAEVERHPKNEKYQVYVKPDRIVIYEQMGPSVDDVIGIFEGHGMTTSQDKENELRDILDEGARFEGVLRFVRSSGPDRTFAVERWSYLGGIDDWIFVDSGNDLEKLAQKTVPLLGTDAFYDLY